MFKNPWFYYWVAIVFFLLVPVTILIARAVDKAQANCLPVAQATSLGNPIPQTKSALVISWTLPESKLIVFQATTKDLADPFEKFGHILYDPKVPNEYWLSVDAFYDFEEVVTYIENYEEKK